MAGAYCRYCGRRCFVYRVLPDRSWAGHMATCVEGMTYDREVTGHDHTTATNPLGSAAAPKPGEYPPGLQLSQTPDGDWRVVHVASGLAIPFLDWPAPGLSLPRHCAEVAAASLAASGIDWTRSQSNLVADAADLRAIADAARVASTAAYDAGVTTGEIEDHRPGPHQLRSRLAAAREGRDIATSVGAQGGEEQ